MSVIDYRPGPDREHISLTSVTCMECGSRFYADGELDCIEGNYYCSFCMPKVQICSYCKKIFIRKKIVRKRVIICKKCQNGIPIKSSFSTTFGILRFHVFKRDNFTCVYCGRSPINDKSVRLHVDHIIPKRSNGQDTIDNLCTSCEECNEGKGTCLLEKHQIEMLRNRPHMDSNVSNHSG